MDARTISRVIRVLGHEAPRWRPTALTVVQQEDRDPFAILVGCLLSLRTKDETTLPAARRLLARARTPAALVRLGAPAIARLIYPVGFYRTKARTLVALGRDLRARFEGQVPDTLDALLTLKGVGRKTANLVVTLGFGKPGVCVDTHVHRISNRLGFVRTKTPEQTEMALRATLPRRHWLIYNDLLVGFGQHICQPLSPWCSRCPVARWCERVGVTRSR